MIFNSFNFIVIFLLIILPYYAISAKYGKARSHSIADRVHLNARGADEFTKDLIIELRKQGECE